MASKLEQRVKKLEEVIFNADKEKKDLILKKAICDPCLFDVCEVSGNMFFDVERITLSASRNPYHKKSGYHEYFTNGEPVVILKQSDVKIIMEKLYGQG